jgi:hypothetical protein
MARHRIAHTFDQIIPPALDARGVATEPGKRRYADNHQSGPDKRPFQSFRQFTTAIRKAERCA